MNNYAATLSARTHGAAVVTASLPVLTAFFLTLMVAKLTELGPNLVKSDQPIFARPSKASMNGSLQFSPSGLALMPFPWTGVPPPAPQPVVSGTVIGKVTYEGTPPRYKPLDMSNEPACAKQYSTPQLPEGVVTGPGNSLQNVIVFISAGAPDEPAHSQSVILEQRGCRYIPHVLVMETNQEIRVQNDDPVAHTIHPMAKINQEWNRSQPPGTPPFVIKYDKPEFIRVKCELHPWMRGIVVVLKNPHFSVSDASGSFSLPELAPGKYTITAWHETFGELSQVVTIGGGETKGLNFVFKVKPY